MTPIREHVREASTDVLRLALDAHIAARLGWPHHARDAARALPDAAARLVIALSPWCATQPVDVEHDEQRTSHATALDALIARSRPRAEPAFDPCTTTSSERNTP